MGRKRWVASALLALAMVVFPAEKSAGTLGLGAGQAEASCRIEVTVCSEIDVVVWRGEVCITYRALCSEPK